MIDKLSQNSRLLVASVIAFLIIFLWQYFYLGPMVEGYEKAQLQNKAAPAQQQIEVTFEEREKVIKEGITKGSRVKIENTKLTGSINLVGARIDDLVLKNYKAFIDPNSPEVVLFSPSKTKDVYFTEFGWSATNLDLPDNKTLWQADKTSLKAGETVTLSWANSKGLQFFIKIKLDDNYFFIITHGLINNVGESVYLSTYSLVNRVYELKETPVNIIHEGPIGVIGQKLKEISYEDVVEKSNLNPDEKVQWLGFTDKYWLTAMIPEQVSQYSGHFSHAYKQKQSRYQSSITSPVYEVKSGEHKEITSFLFAGAKEIDLLDKYEIDYNIKLFDRAVDFGILYFMTKPLFILLHYFYDYIGNFGLAILLLTIVIKIFLFPLAYKGFKGMNRLKDLQPKMMALKERYKDDSAGFQKALIELYRKEKVNPMAGCLPILIQIPIFFALYKVLYVTIEMRHAPFFWWIKDLSAPDPTSIFNLFGLIPWEMPQFLAIGVFPVIMAVTMFIQQKLNPEPTDPMQAKVMKFLPLIFLFMFASFPSGLVIYWSWSNVLSILQQVLIKKLETGKPLHRKTK